MSYKIVYDTACKKGFRKKHIDRRLHVICHITLAALFVACLSSTAVREQLKEFLLPGDALTTETAFTELLQSLAQGEGLFDSVVVFCREIIYGSVESMY